MYEAIDLVWSYNSSAIKMTLNNEVVDFKQWKSLKKRAVDNAVLVLTDAKKMIEMSWSSDESSREWKRSTIAKTSHHCYKIN